MNADTPLGEVFLATTALEEFWDTAKPIVFLGEWCLLYERRAHWGKIDGRTLRCTQDSVDAMERDYLYTKDVYEQLLPLLAAKLNEFHGEIYSDRYWRILVGPWLRAYISVMYDRYVHLKSALDQYPNLTSIVLSQDSFVTPADTLDYFCALLEDTYNLQQYTRILSFLGKNFPHKKVNSARNPLYDRLAGNIGWRGIIKSSVNAVVNFCTVDSKSIYLRNTYFSKEAELKLAARNWGHIQISWAQLQSSPQCEIEVDKRQTFQHMKIGEGEFERCLAAMLFTDIPKCFIEKYSAINEVSRNIYPVKVRVIFSANAWYYDEPFKYWAAKSAEKGVKLLGTQHGGNYGTLNLVPAETHETNIVDRYYSWGWAADNTPAKIVPMPATKLIGKREIGADNNKKGILWVATSVPRYTDAYQTFIPFIYSEYLSWQARFIDALPGNLHKEISFRPHYENYSWGTAERVRARAPNIQIESWSVPFRKRLEDCRLYICDHLSTTFAEALAANKPTLLFVNPQANKFRPGAQKHFQILKGAGILFDTPEAAASAAVLVYSDVEAWWGDAKRQEAVREFSAKFARTSPDAVKLWSEELTRILSE